MATYFTSDVHWQPAKGHDDGTGAFGRFLTGLGRRAAAGEPVELFVLGDLFDFWWERNERILPDYEPHLAALRHSGEAGVRISLLFGNRDFTMGAALESRTGVKIAGDRAEVFLDGRRLSLQHGDLLCTGDRRYQRYRRFIRSRTARALMGLVPFGKVETIVERMRRTSRAEIARKPPESMGVVDAAVTAELARGFDVVICGHVHAPDQRAVPGAPAGCELIVLGPWDEQGGWYAAHEGSGLELRPYRD